MKRSHTMSCLVSALTVFAVSQGNGQDIQDVFGNALTKVSGFNGWITTPLSQGEGFTRGSVRYAGSLKYGPFSIGPKVAREYTIHRSLSVVNGREITDTSVVNWRGDTVYRSQSDVPSSTPPSTPYSETHRLVSYESANAFTLAFGYSHQPRLNFTHGTYTSEFPLGGFFIQALVRPLADVRWLVAGVGGSIFSVTNAKIYRDNVNVALMSVPTYFAPQAFLGLALPMDELTRSLTGLQAFVDCGYEWGTTTEPKYDPVEEGQSLENERLSLPRSIDMSSAYLRVGLSLNVTTP
ncbi:MAG TPA: hypothetical protein VM493_11100 [Vicinamibacterales bacterium]|nr:hypothetical protein [Vicinamibacterales bacterium]